MHWLKQRAYPSNEAFVLPLEEINVLVDVFVDLHRKIDL
jgi:hypothetical protein